MIKTNCYYCDIDDSAFYASENGYTLVKCNRCGLIYLNPRPEDHEIAQAHQMGVHKGDIEIDVTGIFDFTKVLMYQNVLNDLYGKETPRQQSKWLDIGCGHGEFLLALQRWSQNKIKPMGIEPNIRKQKSAQSHGLDVSYFDLTQHTDKYSHISLLNVYSHLPNPIQNIELWKKLLLPNGELLIETGDTAHLDNHEHYRPFYLPDHVSFASEEIIRNILDKCGFEVIKIIKYPFVRKNIMTLGKEIIKLVWSPEKSRLKYVFSSKYNTDMYVRARLKQSVH
jgi:2-polyprenyl-3-methyl-5-hydroxy-6-metoxy-1,4-benzoquinol methylase